VLLPLAAAADGRPGVALGLALAPRAVLVVLLVLLLDLALGGEDELLARVARAAEERDEACGRDEALVRALAEGALHAGGAEAGERDRAREEEGRLGRVERREGGEHRRAEAGCRQGSEASVRELWREGEEGEREETHR